MADPFAPLNPGDELEVHSAAWNAMLAAGLAHRQPGRPDVPQSRPVQLGCVVAMGKNDTGGQLLTGQVAAVVGPGGANLNTSSAAWLRRPVVSLAVPAAVTDFIVVTLEAIPDGKTGRVAISGVVPCEVAVGSGSPPFAAATVGSTDSLTGGRTGTVRVLSIPEDGGSTRRCLVYLHDRPAGPAKWVSDVCLVADAYGAVVGIALFEEHADGRGRCVVRGICEDCGEADVPPPPAPCITLSGTVKLQPEDGGVYAGLYLVGYGGFFSDVGTGAYSVELPFGGATVGFTCDVPAAEAPRDVYYSIDAGASWTLATDIGLPQHGFLYDLPAECEPTEVLWELWATGYAPEVVNPPEVIVSPPAPPVPPVPPPPPPVSPPPISPPVSPPPP